LSFAASKTRETGLGALATTRLSPSQRHLALLSDDGSALSWGTSPPPAVVHGDTFRKIARLAAAPPCSPDMASRVSSTRGLMIHLMVAAHHRA